MLPTETLSQAMARRSLRAAGRWVVARRLDLRVEGSEHLGTSGPALVAARHYHHLYDGCALLAALPRPVSIMAAVDWADGSGVRSVLEAACRMARWPVVLRAAPPSCAGAAAAARPAAADRYLRQATRDVIDLLRAGRLVVIFPEGYPTIDPAGSPKHDDAAFLPFQAGVARLAIMAERRGAGRVPIVPAGLTYRPGDRWQVRLRFGPPIFAGDHPTWQSLLAAVEQQVIELSRTPDLTVAGAGAGARS
jgi:putative membrane protein